MKKLSLFILIAALASGCTRSPLGPLQRKTLAYLDNGLARTPPMGWSSWYGFRDQIDETTARQVADAMASDGLLAAGYKFLNLDDSWMAGSRDAFGHLAADPARFPSGIPALSAYVHARGLSFGLYESVGDKTCLGRPGSHGHEATDAQDFAVWGVDFLKYDNCQHPDVQALRQDFLAMEQALASTGRPIVFSVVVGFWQDWSPEVSNSWRFHEDYGGNWGKMRQVIEADLPLSPYARPGSWNDPDNLHVGLGTLSAAEEETEMALWCMLAAPLIMGNDPRALSASQLGLLTNPELLAVDQDPAGLQATGGPMPSIDQGAAVAYYRRDLSGGDQAWAFTNWGDREATISVNFGPDARSIRSLLDRRDIQSASFSLRIAPHSTRIFRSSK